MKKILIAKDLHTLLSQEESFFKRTDFKIFGAATNEELLNIHIRENVDLIITRLDLPGVSSETIFSIIRESIEFRKVSIIVVCKNTAVERERSARCGANVMITMPFNASFLAESAHRLLNIARRQAYRVFLDVAVDSMVGSEASLWKSENISATGMLVKAEKILSPGDKIACSFYLPPSSKITTTGEIVRVAQDRSGSGMLHYGVKFIDLSPNARTALTAFIETRAQ